MECKMKGGFVLTDADFEWHERKTTKGEESQYWRRRR